MANNRSTTCTFIQTTTLAIVATVGTLFCSLASATDRSSDSIFSHGNVVELSVVSVANKDLVGATWSFSDFNGCAP